MKVLFLFKKIEDKIELIHKNKFPKIFYSYFQFKELYQPDFDDIDFLDISKFSSFILRKSKIADYLIARRINKYDIIIATTDGIIERISSMENRGMINKNKKLIGVVMSFFDDTQRDEKKLFQFDSLITFTKSNYNKLKSLNLKSFFLKLGTDSLFYSSDFCQNQKVEEKSILSIGLDKNRNWDLLKRIAAKLPKFTFRIIAKESLRSKFNECNNIKFLGNIDFTKTRNEICKSKLVFISTKKNSYFSGQTTLLNTTLLKKICVMPYDENFCKYSFNKSYFYLRNYKEGKIVKLLLKIINNQELFNKVLDYNYNLVRNNYNNYQMAKDLYSIIKN